MGQNRIGGMGGQKLSKIVGHHLCTFPYLQFGHRNCVERFNQLSHLVTEVDQIQI